jgi:hypothetical protein
MYKLIQDEYSSNIVCIKNIDTYTLFPLVEENSDYQRFIQDVAEQGIEIVEGPDIREPSYVELRQAAYPSLQDQQDMQYWDAINSTTIWQDTITSIKEQYPKTITGGTTIGPVPSWVQEAADNWVFNRQLREYITALDRLSQYILSEGRPEITEEVVIGQEPTLDENGNSSLKPITQTLITQTAIEPLPEFVDITSIDPETMEPVTETIRNPEIVRDETERAEAQRIVDITPQAVKDAVEDVVSEVP